MNKYVEDCPCGNPYPHGVEFAGRYQFVCDKCGRKTKWFYERNNARYSWNRKIRYKRNKEKGVSMTTPTKEQIDNVYTTLRKKLRYQWEWMVSETPGSESNRKELFSKVVTEWEKLKNSPK